MDAKQVNKLVDEWLKGHVRTIAVIKYASVPIGFIEYWVKKAKELEEKWAKEDKKR